MRQFFGLIWYQGFDWGQSQVGYCVRWKDRFWTKFYSDRIVINWAFGPIESEPDLYFMLRANSIKCGPNSFQCRMNTLRIYHVKCWKVSFPTFEAMIAMECSTSPVTGCYGDGILLFTIEGTVSLVQLSQHFIGWILRQCVTVSSGIHSYDMSITSLQWIAVRI